MKGANIPSLFSEDGRRKYVCGSELPRFLESASRAPLEISAFCRLLAYTGCRITEALELTPAQLDRETGRVVFRTLKRRRLVFRAVPIPPELLASLEQLGAGLTATERIFPWCRQTAWRKVKIIMREARIAGPQAAPKGLRHGFACATAQNSVPLPTIQQWLGHASLATTFLYMHAVGTEERAFAERLWRRWECGP